VPPEEIEMAVLERRSARLRAAVLITVTTVVAACGGSSEMLSNVGDAIHAPTAAPAAAPASEGAAGDGSLPSTGEANPPGAPRDDLRIVYTGSLQLVVADLPAALAKGRATVAAAGGYIGASQEVNDGDRPVATITYRIPANRWEETIGALRGLASRVVAEQTAAAEVGGQVVDLEARIRNLRASEASLQEIARGAGKISDLLAVEQQLTDVRGQIEQLEGQRAQLNDQVAYGTLVTTFGLEVVAVEEAAKGWDPAGDVDAATATLIGAGQTVASAAIWFAIVWLPLILLIVLVIVVARWLFRRFGPTPRDPGPIAGWGG
jgi:hypothetical protein